MNGRQQRHPDDDTLEEQADSEMFIKELHSHWWQHIECHKNTSQPHDKVSTGQATHVCVGQCPKSWCSIDSHYGCRVGRRDKDGQRECYEKKSCVHHGDMWLLFDSTIGHLDTVEECVI